jgi:molybdopterin synthase sulfur carrier subunit
LGHSEWRSQALDSDRSARTLLLRLFAGLREAMGWSEQLVELAPAADATPHQLWRQLGLQPAHPPAGVRVAINQQFATWDASLAAGDELAFLPPISGG